MLWSRARATAQWTNTSNMCWSLCGRARARPQHLGVVLRVFLLFCGAQKPSNQKRLPAGSVRAARATRLAGFSCLGVSTPGGHGDHWWPGAAADIEDLGRAHRIWPGHFFKPREGGQGKQTYKRGTIQKRKATKPNHKSVGAVEC